MKAYISLKSQPNFGMVLEIQGAVRGTFVHGPEPDQNGGRLNVIKLGDDIKFEVAPGTRELVITWPEGAPALQWPEPD